jgi:hypothetical protein
MGESLGVGADHGRARALALQNVCLWCDEFMARYLEPATLAVRPEPRAEPRGRVRLPVTSGPSGAPRRAGSPRRSTSRSR